MNIRKLQGADAKVFARILGQEIGNLPTGKDLGPDEKRAAGIKLVQGGLDRHFDTVWAWLADLGGMTSEELDEAPLATVPELITALGNAEDFQSFLDYVKSLVGKLDVRADSTGS